jgi:hypothetical protein
VPVNEVSDQEDTTVGHLDDARAAAAAFRTQTEQNINMFQAGGQKIAESQQAFRGRLGQTSNPKVGEVDARCNDAKQKIAEAIQALAAARQAAEQFAASLS